MNESERLLPSLQGELSRRLTLLSASWLLALVLVLAWGVKHEVDELLDDALREAAELIYGMVALNAPLPGNAGSDILPAPPHEEHIVWQIVDHEGRLLKRSHRAPAAAFFDKAREGFADGPEHWRVYGMHLPGQPALLYVAQRGAERMESGHEAVVFVVLSAVVVSLFWTVVLRRRVAATLRPLGDMARQIPLYDPLRPCTSLPPADRAEIAAIRGAVAELGQRLARRIENEQAFAAHAAHALRTPLAGMDAQLALAEREAGPDAQPRLARTRAAVERLKRVVQSLLAFFRPQAEMELQTVALADLVAQLPVEGLQIELEGEGSLYCDPSLMSAAVANLMDNAVRHGARRLRLSADRQERGQVLRICDDGPGLDAERRAGLLRQLLGTSATAATPVTEPRVESLGLGLKLAALVAQAHEGELDLAAGEPGWPGLQVVLRLWQHAELPAGLRDGEPMQRVRAGGVRG
ncbi:sensor histidine kinase [Roseateles sp. DB2]|uniref:sensor histidine kinase n=1 Tax=Roseateles sp. DB2 TaxID=3453717 RepID=UPI003EEB9FE8